MLFERQRLLLTLLNAGEPVGHTDFQKLLFLHTRECEATPSYDFVPYKFGGFSFTPYADKRKLIAVGFVAEDKENWRLTDADQVAARRQANSAAQICISFSVRPSSFISSPQTRGSSLECFRFRTNCRWICSSP